MAMAVNVNAMALEYERLEMEMVISYPMYLEDSLRISWRVLGLSFLRRYDAQRYQ